MTINENLNLQILTNDIKILQDRLNANCNHIDSCIEVNKSLLKQLSDEFAKYSLNKNVNSELYCYQNIYQVYTQEFRQIIKKYQFLQSEFHKTVTNNINRKLQILGVDQNELEHDELQGYASLDRIHSFMKSKLLGVNQDLNIHMINIKAKNRDLKKLETEMIKLNQLYQDLEIVVDFQGEQLEKLENNLICARNYNELTAADLVVAEKVQKSNKKVSFSLVTLCFSGVIEFQCVFL